jgi:hypothetical protein
MVQLFYYEQLLNKKPIVPEPDKERNSNLFFDGAPLADYYTAFRVNGIDISKYKLSELLTQNSGAILTKITEIEKIKPTADYKLLDGSPKIKEMVNFFSDESIFEINNDHEIVVGGLNVQPDMGKFLVGILAEEVAKNKTSKPQEGKPSEKKDADKEKKTTSSPPKRRLVLDRKRHGIRRWSI